MPKLLIVHTMLRVKDLEASKKIHTELVQPEWLEA